MARLQKINKTSMHTFKGIALSLFIAGSFLGSIVPIHDVLAGVPWKYFPAEVAKTSFAYYNATFVRVAEQYLVLVDGVAEVQADAYQTVGKGASSAASVVLSQEFTQAVLYLPEVFSETIVSGWADMSQWYAEQFIHGVYRVAEGEQYVLEAITLTMSEASNTIGSSAAVGLSTPPGFLEPLVKWYSDSSRGVDARLSH